MKLSFTLILPLLILSVSVTNAQSSKTAPPPKNMSCKEVIDDYYNAMLKSDAYKKGDKVKAVSHTESVTLADSATVNTYLQKIID